MPYKRKNVTKFGVSTNAEHQRPCLSTRCHWPFTPCAKAPSKVWQPRRDEAEGLLDGDRECRLRRYGVEVCGVCTGAKWPHSAFASVSEHCSRYASMGWLAGSLQCMSGEFRLKLHHSTRTHDQLALQSPSILPGCCSRGRQRYMI
jgi:hypothetical protein